MAVAAGEKSGGLRLAKDVANEGGPAVVADEGVRAVRGGGDRFHRGQGRRALFALVGFVAVVPEQDEILFQAEPSTVSVPPSPKTSASVKGHVKGQASILLTFLSRRRMQKCQHGSLTLPTVTLPTGSGFFPWLNNLTTYALRRPYVVREQRCNAIDAEPLHLFLFLITRRMEQIRKVRKWGVGD